MLFWEPGQPKHGFAGLYAEGRDGYRYQVVLERNGIKVSEISTYDNWEALTRYVNLDRNLDFACRWAQRMEDESKENVARMCADTDGKFGFLPQRTDFRSVGD